MGFTKPTTTQTPDALFDYWLPRLSGGELRVLLYVVRRTFGFGKEQDAISLDQFERGIRTRDGRTLDEGCGVGHATLLRSLRGLEEKGLLRRIRHRDDTGGRGDQVTCYAAILHDPRMTHIGPGFRPVNCTQVPDEVFDIWLARLGHAELAVLCYIIRRTLGFRKITDVISRPQFLRGITTSQGRVLDEGCGVSENALYRAIAGLRDKGLIRIERRTDPERGHLPSRYTLVFAGEAPYGCDDTVPQPAREDCTWPVVLTAAPGGPPAGKGEVQNNGKAGPKQRKGESASKVRGGPKQQEEGSIWGRSEVQNNGKGVSTASREGGPQEGEGSSPILTPHVADQTLVGDNKTGRHDTDDKEQHQQRGAAMADGGGLSDIRIASYADLAKMALGNDVVLLEHGEEEAELLTIRELVRRDLTNPAAVYCVTWTEPCLSVEHILGIGDDWTDAERDKYARLVAARQEAQSLMREIGAPSVEDSLHAYFDDELVSRYLSDDPAETLRVRGWLGYVHRANGSLTNPGGFLRSRLDSCRWPPRGTRRDGPPR